MLTIGLKLLGAGKFLKDLFLQNWKWLVPLILVILAFLWTKDHYYDLGKADETAVWEARVKEEERKNKLLTEALGKSVTTFGKIVDERNSERSNKEVIRETRINTIVEEKPIYQQCLVDQEVIDEQNSLKAMGPKE